MVQIKSIRYGRRDDRLDACNKQYFSFSPEEPLHNIQGQIVCILLGLYFCICIVLMGWSLLPNAQRPFKIYCAPPNLGITRTLICRLKFAQRPIFSGLRFIKETEISDSEPPA